MTVGPPRAAQSATARGAVQEKSEEKVVADSGGTEITRKGEEGNPAYVLAMDKGDSKDGKEVAKKGDKLHSREEGGEEKAGGGEEDEASGKGGEEDGKAGEDEADGEEKEEGDGKQEEGVDVGEKRAAADKGEGDDAAEVEGDDDYAPDEPDAKAAKTSKAKGMSQHCSMCHLMRSVVGSLNRPGPAPPLM